MKFIASIYIIISVIFSTPAVSTNVTGTEPANLPVENSETQANSTSDPARWFPFSLFGEKPAIKTSEIIIVPTPADDDDPTEVDLMCHPKRPLIEPLIAAGLVGNSSRLPLRLKQKQADSTQERKNIILACQITKTNSGRDDYSCKSKKSSDDTTTASLTKAHDETEDDNVFSGEYYDVPEDYA